MAEDDDVGNDKVSLRIPGHIGIIPDGNRRFARKNNKPFWHGHKVGADVFEKMLEWCRDLGVKQVSFWCASTENLARGKEEVDYLFKLFNDFCDNFFKEFDKKEKKKKEENNEKVRIRFIGDMSGLPGDLVDKFRRIEELTRNYSDYKLNLLVNYGGRWEISRAARRIAEKISRI